MRAPPVAYDGRALVRSHGRHEPRYITLHDTESHDVKGIRDLAGIATFWHGVSWGPGAHRGIDEEGNIALYVDDGEIGYHVENHNTGNLGIEQVGFATFSHHVWTLRRKQLEAVAQQCAKWCDQYKIPPRLDVDHGISTHAMQSRAYRGSHTDPGTGYPLQKVLDRVREILAAGDAPRVDAKPYTEPVFWLWVRWRLGEGEFRAAGRANASVRPPEVPAKVPRAWHRRLAKFLERRTASSRQ